VEPETLGVPAHRGGLIAETPQLSVGIIQAVARPGSLEIELLARQPLDRRSATQRQDDIRAGRGGTPAVERRLLPPFDEGMELRAGWIDDAGKARWVFARSTTTSSGDPADGVNGPHQRSVFRFPPMFGRMALVLAWPEIGFPETVVELPLPGRGAVERGTMSVWEAPVLAESAPGGLRYHDAAYPEEDLRVETGRIVALPRVVSRGEHAVVVLSRLTAVGPMLSMEITSSGEGSDAVAVAVLDQGEAAWLPLLEGESSGGEGWMRSRYEYVLDRPASGMLDLEVAWRSAGLPDMLVATPLEPSIP
jgi:hypothetical protein